ncbi:MAG: uracil-DNA glycosylase family protein [Flavobacteriales bacterium]|nr:uracil-DNA glycosylase family protein [Bacteroidota bacterium]MCB9240887.1 uracil-DNA glycosylase family protein [Flavobacteriales bacterium]
MGIEAILNEVRGCTLCAQVLPLGPRPVLSADASAQIAIIGQAPGTRVHETGIPWNDPSGETLRIWMDVSREDFYDASRFAITPMGFCYPGKGPSGDLPPRPECAAAWHKKIFDALPNIEIKLLIGHYAQRYYLGSEMKTNLTETVRAFRDFLPEFLPLPHPSPRNRIWLKRNPWFEADVIPVLRERIHHKRNEH